MVFLTTDFGRETAEKQLDLKSPLGQTKAEELGAEGYRVRKSVRKYIHVQRAREEM